MPDENNAGSGRDSRSPLWGNRVADVAQLSTLESAENLPAPVKKSVTKPAR